MKHHSKRCPKPRSNLIRDESGQGLTEYMILLVLIAITCIQITQHIGKEVRGKLEKSRDAIESIPMSDLKADPGKS